jgi:YVTN family beta-propeller protein
VSRRSLAATALVPLVPLALLGACTSAGSHSASHSSDARRTQRALPVPVAAQPTVPKPPTRPANLLPGMPVPVSATDVYAADRPGRFSPVVRKDRALVYVPNTASNTVSVIDQRSMKVIDTFPVGHEPQHVVPSYDLKTLYVAADHVSADGRSAGSLTPINPVSGKPGPAVPVADPYNLYFTPDGKYGIVVAEKLRRLDFYDPHTWRRIHVLPVPTCPGVDHLDFTADGRTLLASCEFSDSVIAVDVATRTVLRTIALPQRSDGMPQDVKLAPDGRVFYVADMMANGVYVIDAAERKVIDFLPTGRGTHGLYVDRNSTRLFVTNRLEGSVSIIDLATRKPVAKWQLPGGGSPDMGNLSADGKILWLSGRYNGVVYAIDTADGRLIKKIPVGRGPHGLCVWPQPGRYSLGHTGILR